MSTFEAFFPRSPNPSPARPPLLCFRSRLEEDSLSVCLSVFAPGYEHATHSHTCTKRGEEWGGALQAAVESEIKAKQKKAIPRQAAGKKWCRAPLPFPLPPGLALRNSSHDFCENFLWF